MLFSELIEGQTCLAVGGNQQVHIAGIAYDSRQVQPGFLFVAVEGFTTDGHRYVEQAVSRGAVAVVVQKEIPFLPVLPSRGCPTPAWFWLCWLRVSMAIRPGN